MNRNRDFQLPEYFYFFYLFLLINREIFEYDILVSESGECGVPRWSGKNGWWMDGSLKKRGDILTRSGKTSDRVLLTTMSHTNDGYYRTRLAFLPGEPTIKFTQKLK